MVVTAAPPSPSRRVPTDQETNRELCTGVEAAPPRLPQVKAIELDVEAGSKHWRSVWKRVKKLPQKSSHGLNHSPFHNIPRLVPGPAYLQSPRLHTHVGGRLKPVHIPGGWPATAGAHHGKRVSGHLSDSVSPSCLQFRAL